MIGDTEVKDPQFILWIPEKQVFKIAEVKMPQDSEANWLNLTYDLIKNSVVIGNDICLKSLELLASAYIGPIKIFDEQDETPPLSYLTFKEKREFKNKVIRRIVNLAGRTARDYRVPYFSVVVPPMFQEDWSFPERNKLANIKEPYPIGFFLYPTVQLYTCRNTL